MSKAWVLWHRYSDGSAAHVARVYLDKQRGVDDLELLVMDEATAVTGWKLDEVWVYGEAQPERKTA